MRNYNYTYKDIRSEINQAISTLESYQNIPLDAFRLKLNKKTWNCAEVCKHLIQFNQIYIRQMQQAVSEMPGSITGAEPFRPRWLYRKFITVLEPPYRLKIKTVAPLYPSKNDTTPANVVETLIETELQLLKLADRAEKENWDLTRISGKNPLVKFVPMNLIEFLAILLAHQRRHFWQIKQLLDKFGH